MNNTKDYRLIVDPRILKILSENLYTNLYYVISELIANAYDADAHNVYVKITDNSLVVEDDGLGMNDDTIQNYLKVGYESRTDETNSTTELGRKKMGRKGVGKLAALSVAKEYKLMTKQKGVYNGFVVKKDIDELGSLEALQVNDLSFEFIQKKQSGTRVEINDCEINIHKDIDVVAKNLLKMFPIVSSDFKINILYNGKNKILDDYDKEVIKQLATLTTFGNEFKNLKEYFITSENSDMYIQKSELVSDKIIVRTKNGVDKELNVVIKGWIGTYKTTKGRTKLISDFPDNHISIFANGKLGEFNILPNITTTRMTEQYIIGNLYIDCFEDSTLPDMSLSNRQGYNSNDKRYVVAMEMIKGILQSALLLHDNYIGKRDKQKNELKIKNELEEEKKLKVEVDGFNNHLKKEIKKLTKTSGFKDNEIDKILESSKKLIQLKTKVKNQKKKILISHTARDKKVADIVYEMLISNGFDKEEIIYTNCDYEESRIVGGPFGYNIWDYLKEFFVKSYVEQGIYVLFIHSSHMKNSWGAIVEVGAEWITRNSDKQHCIVNISDQEIYEPLRDGGIYISIQRDQDEISCFKQHADTFCQIVEDISKYFLKQPASRTENMNNLGKMLKIQ